MLGIGKEMNAEAILTDNLEIELCDIFGELNDDELGLEGICTGNTDDSIVTNTDA